jgi:hypothetical protein
MGNCGSNYNDDRVVNDTPGVYPWTVYGKNFGNAMGTATLNGQAVRITSWQSATITLDPTMPWPAGGVSTSLRIRTATGLEAVQYEQVIPAISSRIYGQCTYWVAFQRKWMGLLPSPTAYGGYSVITSKYVPKAGDQYQWTWSGGKHTAIALRVTGPVSMNGALVYSLTVDEMNADCRNGQKPFPATFAVKGGSITIPLTHPRLGQTTLYYR